MGNRQFTRVGFRIIASVTWSDCTLQGEVENISLHGIFIKDVCLPIASTAEISIRLSPHEPDIAVRIDAAAVRSSERGTAFEFTRIDVDSFIHLRKIVSYASCDGDAIMGEFTNYVDQKIHEQDETPE